MTQEQKEKIEKIFNHYPTSARELKLVEELGELISAICKADYHSVTSYQEKTLQFKQKDTNDIIHIAEETADVLICLEQLTLFCNKATSYLGDEVFSSQVDKFIDIKLGRQLERLHGDLENEG